MSFVLSVDVGTSRMRCIAIDVSGTLLVQKEAPVEVIHPTSDASELEPEKLWRDFKKLVDDTLESGCLKIQSAACLGITTLRNTFVLWEKRTGRPLCNFSTWQDRRARNACLEWNESLQMKFLHAGASIAHFFTRSKRFKAASVINFITNLVGPRLWWRLNQITDSRRRARLGEICFGTVDSWLVWKLTNGAVHATDYSNVGSTGLYDPYRLDWSGMLLSFLDVPLEMLPEVRDSGGSYGCIAEDIFGASIPITGIISDQTSAMFAHMCWSPGDVKCTLGTGMFIDINTGSNPHASIAGFYPIIGWKIEDDLTYLAEGMFSSIGSAIEWGEKFGLYDDPSETESIATSVDSSCGVCFVPCFDGIQAPYNDPTSTASVIGITHLTRKEHIVRALLESIAFVCKQLFDVGSSEVEYPISKIHVDGGVCRNTFVLQLISDLLCLPIHKPKELDITVYGAAYVAGLGSKFWDSREKIRGFVKHDSELNPSKDGGDKFKQYKLWQSALERSLAWYPRDS